MAELRNTFEGAPRVDKQPQAQQQTAMGAAFSQAGVSAKSATSNRAPDLVELINSARSRSVSCSESSKKYLEVLDGEFEKWNESMPIIIRKTIPGVANSYAIVCGQHAYVLVFAEGTNIPQTDDAVAAIGPEVLANATELLGATITIEDLFVVTAADFERGAKMAQFLENAFLAIDSTSIIDKTTIQSFQRSNIQITVNNTQLARTVFDELDPCGTPVRMDLSIVLTADSGRGNGQADNMFTRVQQQQRTPIAAAAAYVTFSKTRDLRGVTKFNPEVHISGMVSYIHHPAMTLILTSMVANEFIINDGWQAQFTKLDVKSPNMGNLIDDADGSPWTIKNDVERNQFIADYCNSANLFIDSMDGRPRLTGYVQLTNGDQAVQANVLRAFNNFANADIIPTALPLASESYYKCEGYFRVGAEVFDTRFMDYLSTMINHSADKAMISSLLDHPVVGESHNALLRQLNNSIEFDYINRVLFFNADVVIAVRNFVYGQLNLTNTAANGIVNMNGLNGQAYNDARMSMGFGTYQAQSMNIFNGPRY